MSCVFECDRFNVITSLETAVALKGESKTLEFCGEGSFSKVWCTENYVFKIPTTTNHSISSASIFRDAFFQRLCGNHWIDLGEGWFGENRSKCAPVSIISKMTQVKVNTVVDFKVLIHWLVTDLHRMWFSGVRHGDIKPANVCTIMGSVYRFIDYGNAASGSIRHLTPPSNGFRAPEIDEYDKMSNQSEIWSLGATVACIFSKKYLFASMSGWEKVLKKVILTADVSNRLVAEFLRDTMAAEPRSRLTLSQLVLKYGSIETFNVELPQVNTTDNETHFIAMDYPEIAANMTAGQLKAASFLNTECAVPLESALETIFCLINGYTHNHISPPIVKGMVESCKHAATLRALINF